MPQPARLPQNWLEFIWSIYDPYKYILQRQAYGTSVVVGLGLTGGSNILLPEPAYIFGYNSAGWITASGADVIFPYRIGLRDPAGNDWTQGQWASQNITFNDKRAGLQARRAEWLFPREVRENQILVVGVDNNVDPTAAAATVDAVVWGYSPRMRSRPITPIVEVQYIPQTWQEWVWTVFDARRYGIFRQAYSCTIVAGAGLAGQTNIIQVPNDFYCFNVMSTAWVTAGGGVPNFPYRIGIKNATANDWTYGQWSSSALWGTDIRAASIGGQEWMLPREVARNEVLTATVDNNVNAASQAITVDVTLMGYEIRERSSKNLNLLSE